MADFGDLLKTLATVRSACVELSALESLQKKLEPRSSVPASACSADPTAAELDPDMELHGDLLLYAQNNPDAAPFHLGQPTTVFSSQDRLDTFVHYVFNRRFGWSENGTVDRTKRVVATSADAKCKSQINDILDDFLLWFLQEKLSSQMLTSLVKTVKEAGSKPVVRNQTVIHLMEWLKTHIDESFEDIFILVKAALVLGLTDIWSAIRNACASRLSYIVEVLTLDQLHSFFSDLIQICKEDESSWQAKEGAMIGISTVIRRFQWIGTLPDEPVHATPEGSTSAATEYFLKFGHKELHAIPEFISKELSDVIYKMLANPQLSIREHAIKAYSAYISKCEFQEALSSFDEVIAQLCRGIRLDKGTMPDKAICEPGFEFLDAYEAEGLLGVCVHLVKHIAPSSLLSRWPLYFSTFSLYLMHPASTVRQVTSSIFKFLVAKDSSNPRLLKLVLQGLSADWEPDTAFLCAQQNLAVTPELWQGGRAGAGGRERKGSVSSVAYAGFGKRTSALKFAAEAGGTDLPLSSAWEWREGRLLAYELILQFLVKNHWLYTFGSSQLGPPSIMPRGPPLDRALSPPGSSPSGEGHLGHSMNDALYARSAQVSGSKMGGLRGRALHQSFKASSSHGASAAADTSTTTSQKDGNDLAPLEEEEEEFRGRTNSLSSYDTPAWDIPRPHNRGLSQASGSVGTPDGAMHHKTTTLAGIGSPTLRTLVRHYSYYTKSGVPKTSLGGYHSNRAASLLMQTLSLDMQWDKTISQDPSHSGKSNELQTEPGNAPADLEPPCLALLLLRLLNQTMESIADVRWELRRMGQQLLPCVVEVIRWYDMKMLEELWNTQLTPKTTLASYGTLQSFKYSLVHAARLQVLLQEPPSTWQDIELCASIVQHILGCIKVNLHHWLQPTLQLLQRPCFDKVTIVAIETIMVAVSHFQVNEEQKCKMAQAVVTAMVDLCSAAHPQGGGGGGGVAAEPEVSRLDGEQAALGKAFQTPLDGFLCSCHRPERNTQSVAQQIQRHLLNEIHSSVYHFVKCCDLEQMAPLLPMFVFYLGQYAEDESLMRVILDCVTYLCGASAKHIELMSSPWNDQEPVCSNSVKALAELANLLTIKSLDLQTVRQVLDLCGGLTQVTPAPRYATVLLQAVANRINQVVEPCMPMMCVEGATEHDADLALRSNDIPVAPITDVDELSSEEDDVLDPHPAGLMQECALLNVSGGSGGNPSRKISTSGSVALSQGAAPSAVSEDDDWDDWDDDEQEDTSVLSSTFAEFLQNLKQQQTRGGVEHWQKSLAGLTSREQKQIDSLLQQGP